MSSLNLNNIINIALVLGAVLSGIGLTACAKETGGHPEVLDLAGMTKVRDKPLKSKSAPPDRLKAWAVRFSGLMSR